MDAPGIALLCAIAAPLVLAPGLWLLPGRWGARVSTVVLAAEVVVFAWLGADDAEPRFALPWIDAWGIRIAFRLDSLARTFTLLACGIGALVFAYSDGYMPHEHHRHGSRRPLRPFFQLLLLFVFSMLGIVCADDLLTLYVFWELSTAASFLLIAYHLREVEARAAALHALALTGGGGILLLVALVVLLVVGGASSISELVARPAGWLSPSPLAPLFAFGILVAAFAKSAQFPFYGWLPDAMSAPTPVSALLHSATVVATGVFLLARLGPLLADLPGLSSTLVLVGAATALLSGGVALARTRMKEMLAWSTVCYHGQAVLLLGLGAESAALYLVAYHAVSKAGLFLVTGSLSYTTGADDVRDLGGLWRTHPVLMVLTGILALGLAGLPFTAGFWMKEVLFAEVYARGGTPLVAAAMAIAILSAACLVRFFWAVFFAPPHVAPSRPEPVPSAILLAPGVLAATSFAAGIGPRWGAELLVAGAAEALHLEVPWPWPPRVYTGVFCLPLGAVVFAWLQARWNQVEVWTVGTVVAPSDAVRSIARRVGPARLFPLWLALLERLGAWSARLQTGRLLHYVVFLVSVPVVAGVVLLPRVGPLPAEPLVREADPGLAFFGLAVGIAAMAVASTLVRRHVSAIVCVGGVGFLLALIFALLRAPDIAFVQMVVETGTALLLLAALGRIPIRLRAQLRRPEARRGPTGRWATAIVAALLGTILGLGLLVVVHHPRDPALGRALSEWTAELGVDSVVKAILAEFRAMDTFGEVAVFAAAVLGAVLLLGRRAERRPPAGEAEQPKER